MLVQQMESNHTMLLKEMTKMQRMLSRSLSAAGQLPNQASKTSVTN